MLYRGGGEGLKLAWDNPGQITKAQGPTLREQWSERLAQWKQIRVGVKPHRKFLVCHSI